MASSPDAGVREVVKLLKPDTGGHMQRIFSAHAWAGGGVELLAAAALPRLVASLCAQAAGAAAPGSLGEEELFTVRAQHCMQQGGGGGGGGGGGRARAAAAARGPAARGTRRATRQRLSARSLPSFSPALSFPAAPPSLYSSRQCCSTGPM